jgi:hypothetical protein
MNQAIPLYVVLSAAAAGVLLWLINRWVSSIIQSARRMADSIVEFQADLKTARAAIQPAVEDARANLAAVPKLLEAVAKIGSAQLETAQRQRAEQEERARNPFGRNNAPAAPRDTTAANMEYEVQQAMRAEGISREEALLRANPANEKSVWDGDAMFSGWRKV